MRCRLPLVRIGRKGVDIIIILGDDEPIETNNALEGTTMSAHEWKKKQFVSECVASARRKMRTARQMDRKGSAEVAALARTFAADNLRMAREVKAMIHAVR